MTLYDHIRVKNRQQKCRICWGRGSYELSRASMDGKLPIQKGFPLIVETARCSCTRKFNEKV